MATERGNLFISGLKAKKDLQSQSRDQARAGWEAARAGVPGSAPLDEFLSSDNTRYARDVIGWDKAQDMRKKAEAADVGATPPPGRWDRRYNYVTNEMEWVQKDPSNFWKANKDELIQMGGFIAGSLVGMPMLGAGLAKTARDVYKIRDARRDFKDDKREWEYQQMLDAQDAARYGPQRGNLFKNIGEGTVEWATKDIERNKRKGTYERGAV